MADVRVSSALPYLLLLPPGEYTTPAEGGSIQLNDTQPGGGSAPTTVHLLFDVDDGIDIDIVVLTRHKQADRLLRRVNHLLRWYRATTGDARIIDLTRAQASPFHFTIEGTTKAWGGDTPLEYEAASLPIIDDGDTKRAALGEAIRLGLAGGTNPEVATLNVLDAEYAVSVGRFREAVLLCWGAIDSTFVRKFDSLVDTRFNNEWAEARNSLKDMALRHKMTAGLRLLTGRSLYVEPAGFWRDLCASYNQRNKIIHEGEIASEDDAKNAIKVARQIVKIVAFASGLQLGSDSPVILVNARPNHPHEKAHHSRPSVARSGK